MQLPRDPRALLEHRARRLELALALESRGAVVQPADVLLATPQRAPDQQRHEADQLHARGTADRTVAPYRIVQEALTNARRHAAGSHAAVTLRWRRGELGIEVVDDGPGPAPSDHPPGHGLIGLRERAALYGGGIETGTAGPAGGFRLRARLPIETPGA